MSPEFAARVFDAFERECTSTVSNIQGTGLGMAITKGIIDLMGGTIKVITAPGAGTEVIINLQLEIIDEALVSAEASEKKRVKASDYDFRGTHLLLVEDNEINREIAAAILMETGFTLETAVNGQEAVDIVSAVEPGHFDLILMDVQMPVMVAEDIQAARSAAMNGHIAKPIDISGMLETIREVLDGRVR